MGNDTAQSIIDQIVQSHESGGRAQMFAAPSMRIGAGFMNPMATARKLFCLHPKPLRYSRIKTVWHPRA